MTKTWKVTLTAVVRLDADPSLGNGVVKADTVEAKRLGLPTVAAVRARDSWLDEVSADDGPIDGYDH